MRAPQLLAWRIVRHGSIPHPIAVLYGAVLIVEVDCVHQVLIQLCAL